VEVEQLVADEHPVRAIWELSGCLDLAPFAVKLRTQRELGGRAAWDPRLLVAVWIWAYSNGVSSAREIERQADYRPELQWLCGLEVIKHHTLSDFRVAHLAALEQIFTQVLAVLNEAGLIDLKQVAIDGTRVRSQGATSSRRRRGTIEKHLEQARAVVQELSGRSDDEESSKRRLRGGLQRAVCDGRERKGRGGRGLDEAGRGCPTTGADAQGRGATHGAAAEPSVGGRRLQLASEHCGPAVGGDRVRDAGAAAGSGFPIGGAGGGDTAWDRVHVFHLRRKDGHVSMSGKQDAGIPASFKQAWADIPAIPGTERGLQSV